MIPWNNESVWLDALPQNKTVSRWPVFHGSVILPYILKAIWCINMILWANKSVWLNAWPQNKSWSLWPIFHGSVAYILKTNLCIRRWHWPGVYVSPSSLALVAFVISSLVFLRDCKTFWNETSHKHTAWLCLYKPVFADPGLLFMLCWTQQDFCPSTVFCSVVQILQGHLWWEFRQAYSMISVENQHFLLTLTSFTCIVEHR